jgi:hypothetical protein
VIDEKLRYYIVFYSSLGTFVIMTLVRLLLQNLNGLKLKFHNYMSNVDGAPDNY